MVLSKFYQFLYGHAVITLREGRRALYHGPLHGIPDEFDSREVIDFTGTNTGCIFYLKAKRQK